MKGTRSNQHPVVFDGIKVWGSLGPSEAGTACTAAQEV
jgi:hypothetical protein